MSDFAASRIFSNIDILRLILAELDLRTLLLSQRVARSWKDVIVKSHLLQELLFFRAKKFDHNDLTPEYTLNPLLTNGFSAFLTGCDISDFREIDLPTQHKLHLDYFGKSEKQKQSSKAAFMYTGASWRRMLPRQPPARRVQIFETRFERFDTNDPKRYWVGVRKVKNEDEQWLRMGALYDFVSQVVTTKNFLDTWEIVWSQKPLEGPRARMDIALDKSNCMELMKRGDVTDIADLARADLMLARLVFDGSEDEQLCLHLAAEESQNYFWEDSLRNDNFVSGRREFRECDEGAAEDVERSLGLCMTEYTFIYCDKSHEDISSTTL